MKTNLCAMFLGAMLFALPGVAHAQFIFATNNGVLLITKYTGNGAAVTIPGTTNGLPIAIIANGAFQNNNTLTNVTIPGSITNVGDFAFQGCAHLTAIYFQGNEPIFGANVFSNPTLYYLPGTSGWALLVEGRPTVMLNPPIPSGSLKVTLSPATAIAAGMQWQVDGGVAQSSGATVLGLAVGSHTVTFSTANGWAMPASQSVVVNANSTTAASGIYGQLTYFATNGAIVITHCTNGGAIILPGTINGLPVTTISSIAFQNITTLTSLTIPSSVTNFWGFSFQGCGNLAVIYFQGNAPVIGFSDGSFNGTNYYLPGTSGWGSLFGGRPAVMLNPPNPAGSLKVTLAPATAIAAGMQWQVDGGVAQPSAATVLGLAVGNHTVTFSTANGWAMPVSESVVVSANSTTITNAIYGQLGYITTNGMVVITQCTNGGAIILPSTINGLPVTTMSGIAFQNITTLTSITIPGSVTNIWAFSFQGCWNLTALYFQGNAPTIGYYDGSFMGTVYYLPGTSGWGSLFGGRQAVMLNPPNPFGSLKVTLSPAAITNVAQWQADGGLAQVSGATVLGLSAGNHTVSFSPVNGWAMPASQSVAVNANSTATASLTYGQLTYVTNNGTITIIKFKGSGDTILPNTINNLPVTTIQSQAFENSTTLTSVTIPNNVTNIGTGAFATYNGLTSLMTITVNPGNSFYSSTNGVLFNQSQTVLLQAPNGVAGSYSIPQSVTNIEEGAFGNCANLTSVTVPDSVILIGPAAFYGCIGMTNVTFGTNLYEIEDQAFQACYGLTSIVIPKSINLLGTWTFAFCYNLTNVYFLGNTPPFYFPDYPPFELDTNATIYYLPGTTGWGTSDTPFGDCPAAPWLPQAQTSAASFGVQANQFGFNITWASDTTVVVDACTDLANPVWTPVGTNLLTGGSSYFTDSQWTNYPGRFYRLRSP